MSLTKDEVSDLRSYRERIVVCTLDNERSRQALLIAKKQLEDFLWRAEHERTSMGGFSYRPAGD